MEDDSFFPFFDLLDDFNEQELMPDWINEPIIEEIDDNALIESVEAVEKKISSSKTEQARFASLKYDDLQQIVNDGQAKSTKKSTKWSIKIFTGTVSK
jgi:hypothetical protein